MTATGLSPGDTKTPDPLSETRPKDEVFPGVELWRTEQGDLQKSFGFRDVEPSHPPACCACTHCTHSTHDVEKIDWLPKKGARGASSLGMRRVRGPACWSTPARGRSAVFDGSTEHAVSPQDQRVDPGLHESASAQMSAVRVMHARITRSARGVAHATCERVPPKRGRTHSPISGPVWGLWSGGSGWGGVVLPPGVPGFARCG